MSCPGSPPQDPICRSLRIHSLQVCVEFLEVLLTGACHHQVGNVYDDNNLLAVCSVLVENALVERVLDKTVGHQLDLDLDTTVMMTPRTRKGPSPA